MTGPEADPRFHQLAERLVPQGRLISAETLPGGSSARVTKLSIAAPSGEVMHAVMRQHGDQDRARDSDIARTEFRLLECLAAHGIAAPRPLLTDAELFETPVLLVSFLDGTPEGGPSDLPARLHEVAQYLARLHQITGDDPALSALPRLSDVTAPRNMPVLLHGDVWPHNLLWQSGRLAGLIDWEDACLGDPLADIARARLEFALAYGAEAARFLAWAYAAQTRIDFALLPYWDRAAAARLAPRLASFTDDAQRLADMRSTLASFEARAEARIMAREAYLSEARPQ